MENHTLMDQVDMDQVDMDLLVVSLLVVLILDKLHKTLNLNMDLPINKLCDKSVRQLKTEIKLLCMNDPT